MKALSAAVLLPLLALPVAALPEPPAPLPQLSAPLGGLTGNLQLENGRLRRGSFYDPETRLELELGNLGGGTDSPLLGSSPYISLGRSWTGSGNWFDWDVRGRLSAVDLNARWFDSIPGPDPLVRDRGGDPTALSSEYLYFGSVLGRVGRAYPLWGPVDVGWSLMGIVRADHYFPSLSLDQTVGARLRLGEGHSVGLFGGVTEGLALLTRDWAARAVSREADPTEPRLATSPHLELGAWGPLSGSTAYQVWLSRQKDEFTTTDRLQGALSRPGLGGNVSVGLRAEREVGGQIEFAREERALRLSVERRNGFEWSVEAGRRQIDYGGAGFDGGYVQFGLTIREKVKDRALSLSHRSSSGRISEPEHRWARELQDALRDTAAAADRLLSRATAALDKVDPARAVAELRASYEALPADFRAALDAELGGPPDFDRLERELAVGVEAGSTAVARERERLDALQAQLSDPKRLERIVTRQLRLQLYEALQGTDLKLWGREMPLTPGLLLAIAHAYGQGQGLIAPVGSKDLGPALDVFLTRELEKRYGASCPGGDLLSCASASLPPEVRERLRGVPEQRAREIIASALGMAADSVRLEMNRYLLSVYLSAKTFDALTVERGETPGTLNRRGVVDSFGRLDERRKEPVFDPMRAALAEGARRLQTETAEQERRLLEDAQRRAAVLKGELAAAGVTAEEAGLPRMVLDYGEENLRTFAAEARSKLAARGKGQVALRYDPSPFSGVSIVHEKDGRTVLTLPPASGRNPGRLLDALTASL